jgi:outer membrane protein assembly factor BamB
MKSLVVVEEFMRSFQSLVGILLSLGACYLSAEAESVNWNQFRGPNGASVASTQDAATKASGTEKVHVEDRHYWNQFRGPNGDGKSLAKNLPVEFSETINVRWKTPIHDEGWSSPVVWSNQIWLTTGREDGSELFTICVDLESGDIVHDIKVFDVAKPQKAYEGLNSHATPTPVIEDGRIYVHFGTYGTACLDTESGKKLWERRDLNCDHRVRPASSPIIDGDSLFLCFDGVDAQFIVALDKKTGKSLWLKNREVESDFAATLRAQGVTDVDKVMKEKPNDNRKSYATPTIIEHQGQRQLISPAAEVTFSYAPKTGKKLWRVRHESWGWNAACRPVFEHGLVYFTTGFSKQLLAVQPSGTGDVTETHVAWSTRRNAPSVPSPLIVGDLLFMVSDQGFASCLEAKTGRELWKERLRAGGDHWASPLYADGKIYFSGKKGIVSVVAAERKFRLLAENRFEASFIASPAIAGDAIILRSLTHLYCVAEDYEMVPQPEIAGKPKPSQIASSDLEALQQG